MQVFFSSTHESHQPPFEVFNGQQTPHQEVPDRVDRILNALSSTQHQIEDLSTNKRIETETVRTVRGIHKEEYLNFLQQTSQRDDTYHYPSVFPYRPESPVSTNAMIQSGSYCFDMFTPINAHTYASALASASVALHATQHTITNGKTSYALCRPPGHHAEPAKMGGYCYFNNGAVAVETARSNGYKKIALLDVDFHHGNGAEKIYENDASVLTVSLHANPEVRFPYYSGHATNEYTENLNIPLPLGTDDQAYDAALQTALNRITTFNPDFLVVSYGADTHESDPIGGFKLTTDYFAQMAETIANLSKPTVILQEGGYNTDQLGKNVVSFLSGF